jgi:hypothetical protein
MCQSVEDLQLYINFLRSTSLAENGLPAVLVGVAASLGEARRLAGLVRETYGPMVQDLIESLEDLQAAVRKLQDQETVGAVITAVGEAIAAIGTAMDALAILLRDPCPAAPAGSAAPTGSVSPEESSSPGA